jgi:hypothetical protein
LGEFQVMAKKFHIRKPFTGTKLSRSVTKGKTRHRRRRRVVENGSQSGDENLLDLVVVIVVLP